MKNFLLLITVLGSSFVFNAQVIVKDVAGIYETKLSSTSEMKLSSTSPHIINYTLNLNTDGTFHFHSYDKMELVTPGKSRFNERNKYAKGIWTLDKNVVSFYTLPTHFDENLL